MDPTLALILIRGLANLFTLQGQPKTAGSLNLLASGIESGAEVNEHMQAVADKLKETGGTVSDEDWADVHARINADSARLQGL